jgi:hypothetical protein
MVYIRITKEFFMKVNISGINPVSSDQVKWCIDKINKEYAEYGLVVKNLVCYIRFQDEDGNTVDPTENGNDIEKKFTFTKSFDSWKKDKEDLKKKEIAKQEKKPSSKTRTRKKKDIDIYDI